VTGTVASIKPRFGFIKPDDGGADYFFIPSSLSPELFFDERLKARRVEFDIEETGRPRARAVNIRPVGY
jgi:cold shock CspA family protein